MVIVNTYQSKSWSIDLLKDWIIEEDEDVISIYKEDGVGALQISAYTKEGGITDEELKAISQDNVSEKEQLTHIQCGDFFGYYVEDQENGTFWRKWFLYRNGLVIFATYNSDLQYSVKEKIEVDRMINSLKLKEQITF